MRCITPANCLFVPLILLGLVFIYYFTNKYQQFGNFIIFLSSVLRFTANMLCSCNLCICRFKGESLHCVICLALSNVINVLGPFLVESHVILSTCTKNLESKEPEFKKILLSSTWGHGSLYMCSYHASLQAHYGR